MGGCALTTPLAPRPPPSEPRSPFNATRALRPSAYAPLQVLQGFMLGVVEGIVPASHSLDLNLPVAPMTSALPLKLHHARGAECASARRRTLDPRFVPLAALAVGTPESSP